MNDFQEKLDYADAIADWFLELSESHSRQGHLDDALKCTDNAAWILSRQNRILSSERLESVLRFIAEHLTSSPKRQSVGEQTTDQKPTCLHVMSEALPAGGMTALAIRWMKNDDSSRTHSAALLSQQSPVPDEFHQAVVETGGCVYVANRDYSLSQRASWLRSLSSASVSHIILHAAFTDVVVWGTAFGVPGGPPVLLVNHAANLFWGGGSIVDLVVNVRGSELEKQWTVKHRGIPRCATIPIPLVEPDSFVFPEAPKTEDKRIAKDSLRIPSNAVVILTVGAHFKYLPIDGLDFVVMFESILRVCPDAYLLAVGFKADRRWKQASAQVESRIRTLGVMSQSQLDVVHAAADIYVEGFPFGTTTALLEAGLKGIPVVLSPAHCPAPYGTDGVALDNLLVRAQGPEEYKANVIRLLSDLSERASEGQKIRESIIKHHTGEGWREYLSEAFATLPREHDVYSLMTPVQTPPAIHELWTRLTTQWSSGLEETFDNAVVRALGMGIRPHMTKSALQACRYYKSLGVHKGVPVGFSFALCNAVFRVMPIASAKAVFRLVSFLCRPSFAYRLWSQCIYCLGVRRDQRQWYDDYRNVAEQNRADRMGPEPRGMVTPSNANSQHTRKLRGPE